MIDKNNKLEAIEINEAEEKPVVPKPDQPGKIKKIWKKYLEKKKITFPLTILVVFLIIFLVPVTRYKVLGLFIKRTVTVNLYDSKTNKPISDALVEVDGKSATSDGGGQTKIEKVKVGYRQIKVTKKYYKDSLSDITVTLRGTNTFSEAAEATGRQVPVSVNNLVNSKSVKGATIKSSDSSATTDEQGNAVLVTSPSQEEVEVTIKADEFNEKTAKLKVTDDQIDENKVKLTPSGKVYFVSKQSGKNDVVETNLDGSERKVIVPGTGKEQDDFTSLSVSRDWRYLSLFANRDGKNNIYIVDVKDPVLQETQKDYKMTIPIGWHNQYFVYSVEKEIPQWQAKRYSLISYDSEKRQNIVLDENRAEGTSDIDYASEQYTTYSILQNEVVYSKIWYADFYSGGKIVGKQNSINSINPAGVDKKNIKEFEAKIGSNFWINTTRPKPQILNFSVSDFTQYKYFEYQSKKLTEKPQTSSNFDIQFPKYILSPSGNKTTWSEPRDGKNAIFIGDLDAEESKQIVDKTEYKVIGWYSDDYLLLSKNGSELYISEVNNIANPIKISDFQPNSFNDMGGGYSYVIQ